ncbi:MAG: type II toxin-antitoxin system RelE/ParE family toxin, partial [Planctomycetaceae bacterium]|nr:type II toxin-antitoxin system RelE/ParE family toxin [Planctomycetaceae bacterium]
PGLADDFFSELQAAFNHIRENPHGLPRLEEYSGEHDVRRCLTARFPYAVIFRIRHDEVVVIAVAHTHRRPLYWLSRL